MTFSMLAGIYLFLGGAGAGVFFFAALAEMPWASQRLSGGIPGFKNLPFRGYVLSLVMLTVGAICLIFDLGRPAQALLLFRFTMPTLLTFGAYGLVTLMFLSGVFILMEYVSRKKNPRSGALFCVLKIAGMVLALGIMLYTGLLLQSLKPVPLWRSGWLPPLFVASSLAAGLSGVLLCAGLPDLAVRERRLAENRLCRIDLALVALEIVVCAGFVLSTVPGGGEGNYALVAFSSAAATSATDSAVVAAPPFISPSVLFWGGFVGCGLIIPTAIDIFALSGLSKDNLSSIGALFSLAGCLSLRLCLVVAGTHVVI